MHWKIHPPRPSRFPSGGDFAPLGPRDCPRASPSGNLSGLGVQNPRPWEISWASGSVFSNTSLPSAVYGYNGQCNTIVLQCNTIQVPFLQERSMWSGKIAIRRGRNKSRRYVAEILQFLQKKSYNFYKRNPTSL